jgi:hypothetical protein
MTQYYKVPNFTLAGANASTKVLVTCFLATVLAGLGVALLQYHDRAGGFGAAAALDWVRGNEDDPDATRILGPKTTSELIAITHEHAFSVPILAFVVLHLLALTSISEAAKIAFYLAGFLSIVATFAAPWLVHSRGESWTPLLRIGGAGLTAVLALSSLVCLYELWLGAPMRRWRRRPPAQAPNPMFPKLRQDRPPPSDAGG